MRYRIAFLFLPLLFSSCASVDQALDKNETYRRDIQIQVNGQVVDGIGVVPSAPIYNFTVNQKEEAALLLFRSCHREVSRENVKNFSYVYAPVKDMETDRACAVEVHSYDSKKGKHGWGLIEFKSSYYTLPFEVTCNGVVTQFDGVGVCQGRVTTTQKVKFNTPVRFAKEMGGCTAPKKVQDWYEIELSKGDCLYIVESEDKRVARFTMSGFSEILVRSTQ